LADSFAVSIGRTNPFIGFAGSIKSFLPLGKSYRSSSWGLIVVVAIGLVVVELGAFAALLTVGSSESWMCRVLSFAEQEATCFAGTWEVEVVVSQVVIVNLVEEVSHLEEEEFLPLVVVGCSCLVKEEVLSFHC
jgi:hypothetical protein